MSINLKDIYQSIQHGKELKRLRERKTNKKNINTATKQTLTEELLTEDFITRWLDRFFDSVKTDAANDIIKNAIKTDPKLGQSLYNIKKNADEVSDMLSKNIKMNPNYKEDIINKLLGL